MAYKGIAGCLLAPDQYAQSSITLGLSWMQHRREALHMSIIMLRSTYALHAAAGSSLIKAAVSPPLPRR